MRSGAETVAVAVGFGGVEQAKRTWQGAADFASFATSVAQFTKQNNKLIELCVDYVLSSMSKDQLHQLRMDLASRGFEVAASSAIKRVVVSVVAQKFSETSARLAYRSGLKSAMLVLTAADFVGQSTKAAQRLERAHPVLANNLRRSNVIGGYFLVEDALGLT